MSACPGAVDCDALPWMSQQRGIRTKGAQLKGTHVSHLPVCPLGVSTSPPLCVAANMQLSVQLRQGDVCGHLSAALAGISNATIFHQKVSRLFTWFGLRRCCCSTMMLRTRVQHVALRWLAVCCKYFRTDVCVCKRARCGADCPPNRLFRIEYLKICPVLVRASAALSAHGA